MRTALVALVVGSVLVNAACLDRPVVATCPGSAGLSIGKIRVTRVDKVDLLIVVDNSISMADKQSELGRRMPELIAALTDPTPDPKTGKPSNVLDMHIGVITSSLGSHGTSACAVEITNKANNDRGHLLPRAGEGGGKGWSLATANDATLTAPTVDCPTPVAATPLSWVFKPESDPSAQFKGHPTGSQQLEVATSCVVASAKEQGCGYEETWEAMYHFLADPAPYAKAEVNCTFGINGDVCAGNKIVVEGLDEELLAQRKAFLRPDSLLAVIILSDENDASLKPAGLNWLPWGYGKGQMQRGWAACENVPDDFEPETTAEFIKLHDEYKCFSCFEKGGDANCTVPWAKDPLNNDVDGRNLRAMRQTNRYGYNFLWGRQRYVDALTNGQVVGSDNKLATNPIFAGGFRTQEMIVVATIVGVPKRLVADSTGSPKELTEADWELIQGPIGKRDPHMIETVKPRDGIARYAGDRSIDPVNGGDRDITDGDDLQYACIAPRSAPGTNNDCDGTEPAKRNPLCATDGTQPYFKAYPGLRHLRIAKDLGVSGFVSSICSESYKPAIQGITNKLRVALNAQCLRTSLSPDPSGNVKCLIIESLKEGTDTGKRCEELAKGLCTPGAAPCRRAGSDYPPISPEQAASQLNLPIVVIGADGSAKPTQTQAIAENGNVYAIGEDQPTPKKHLICEIEQFAGDKQQSCITDENFKIDPSAGGGWCYSREPAIVGPTCQKLGAPGTIRFFGGAEPRNGSEVFTYCIGGGGCGT
jgi:hypothetical protein